MPVFCQAQKRTMANFLRSGKCALWKNHISANTPLGNFAPEAHKELDQDDLLLDLLKGWNYSHTQARAEYKSLKHYVSRLKEYQKQYFEEVERRMRSKKMINISLVAVEYSSTGTVTGSHEKII